MCFFLTSVCSRWLRINDTAKRAIVFDTVDPAWKTLYSEKTPEEKETILQDILSKTGNYIQRFCYHAMSFTNFPGDLERVVRSIPNIKSVIIMHWTNMTEIGHFALHCRNIVEFRMSLVFNNCDDVLSELFTNNDHLEIVSFSINGTEGKCFQKLEGKPIKELQILGQSKKASKNLVQVLYLFPLCRKYIIKSSLQGTPQINQFENIERRRHRSGRFINMVGSSISFN